MLEANTRIYVCDPDREDDRVPGVVSETLGQKVMVRFLQPVSFKPGAETVLYFHNQSNCFTSVPCKMQRMFSKGQYPTGSLVLVGEAEVAENRSAFRIDILDQTISASVNSEATGEVVNISSGGIALMLDAEDYTQKAWLDVTLDDGSGIHNGRMQVCSKFRDKDGRYRYGLMADPSEPDLISQLSRITQEKQKEKARRASRIGTNNKTSVLNKTNTATSDKDKDKLGAADDAKPEKPASPDGTKRLHQRNPWPGMAKVYIREDHNVRVLSVDTADLSRGGISFLSPQYIYEGSEALYEKPIGGGFFRVMVAIRNVQALEGGAHRIGAEFLGAPIKAGKMPKDYDSSATAA